MPFLLPIGGFRQTVDEIEKQLAYYGDVRSNVQGATTARCSVSFEVSAPGYGAETVAEFVYRERYRRAAGGWLREHYVYEYRAFRSRTAHHQHGAWGVHRHCEATGHPSRAHYADVERLLQPTHEGFVRLYERAQPVRCFGLRRLTRPPRGDRGEPHLDE